MTNGNAIGQTLGDEYSQHASQRAGNQRHTKHNQHKKSSHGQSSKFTSSSRTQLKLNPTTLTQLSSNSFSYPSAQAHVSNDKKNYNSKTEKGKQAGANPAADQLNSQHRLYYVNRSAESNGPKKIYMNIDKIISEVKEDKNNVSNSGVYGTE